MKPAQAEPFDCLIIGAGPAGLTAATYLARFRRNTVIVDSGCSRAALIPTSHNTRDFLTEFQEKNFWICCAVRLLIMEWRLLPGRLLH